MSDDQDDRSRIEVIDIQETISSTSERIQAIYNDPPRIEVANIGVKLIQPFVGKDHS